MRDRIRQRLPLAVAILALVLTVVPAVAHGVRHARFAHKAKIAKTAKNANNLDGQDSTAFAGAGHNHDGDYAATGHNHDGAYYDEGSKVADSDELDGHDSSVFREYIDHASQPASACDAEGDNLCAPLSVEVPEGDSYRISVWSEMVFQGPASNVTVDYCSARSGDAFDPEGANPSCITPFAVRQRVTVPAGEFTAASTSGETVFTPQGGGDPGHTFQVGTILDPSAPLGDDVTRALVYTKVRVWDADADAGGCDGTSLC